jgi:hypothetical protein
MFSLGSRLSTGRARYVSPIAAASLLLFGLGLAEREASGFKNPFSGVMQKISNRLGGKGSSSRGPVAKLPAARPKDVSSAAGSGGFSAEFEKAFPVVHDVKSGKYWAVAAQVWPDRATGVSESVTLFKYPRSAITVPVTIKGDLMIVGSKEVPLNKIGELRLESQH